MGISMALVPYPDGSEWLLSPTDISIPTNMLDYLTAEEIGARVLALLAKVPRLSDYRNVWGRDFGMKTLQDIEAELAVLEAQPRWKEKPPRALHPAGFVYVIHGGGYYKIGRTVDPYTRLTPMMARAPFPFEALLLIPTSNMAQTERELHRTYAAQRTRGEWFNLTDADIAEIRSHYTTIDPTSLQAS
jgi:hypothetical protein